jgi:hypothetical protein
MDQVLVGLGDVDEDPGEKLERVDEGLVVDLLSCFGLIEAPHQDGGARGPGTCLRGGASAEGAASRLEELREGPASGSPSYGHL